MDLNELERRLQQLGEDCRRSLKLTADLKSLELQLSEARTVRLEWQQAVEDASDDLRKLEGMSLTALFHSLFGDRKLRIKDEKERLLQAKLRHDASDEEIGPLEQQVADVQQRIELLGDVEARRNELLAHKEQLLRERGGDSARRLVESAEKLGEMRDQLRELEEADLAGREVLPCLRAAKDEMGSASNWGTFDMVGGGVVASMAKHSSIDRARTHVSAAQRKLRDFVRELQDVDMDGAELSIEIGGFSRFSDIFFDNLITDWFVQSQISDASGRIAETTDRVRQMLFAIDKQKRELAEQLAAAEAQRQQWIEDAS